MEVSEVDGIRRWKLFSLKIEVCLNAMVITEPGILMFRYLYLDFY